MQRLELLGGNEAPFENAIQYFGPRVNDAASGALAEIGEPAVAGLIETLKSEDITIRMKAADTLSSSFALFQTDIGTKMAARDNGD